MKHPNILIEKMQIHPESAMAVQIRTLPGEDFKTLCSVYDPDDDYLIHVDQYGFTVNHGNVGTRGIRYDFD